MNSSQTHLPYEMSIFVQHSDIDELGHVNNVVFLKWVQDVAIAHWSAVATDEQKRTLLWVVARHEIDYKRPAYEAETIIARTWVGGATHRLFERHTELLRRSDRKILAKALTLWAPIDIITKGTVRAPSDVYRMFSTQMIDMPNKAL